MEIWTTVTKVSESPKHLSQDFLVFTTKDGDFYVMKQSTKLTPTSKLRNKLLFYDVIDNMKIVWYVEDRTVDIVPLSYDLKSIFLIKRKDSGCIALPGGHIDPPELPLDAAYRELSEETLNGKDAKNWVESMTQIGDWTKEKVAPGKHSAEYHSCTMPFKAIMKPDVQMVAGDDAIDGKWYKIEEIPWDDFHFLHHIDIIKCVI